MCLAHEMVCMAVDERDTSQTAVKTYVPAYQVDEWDEHADELDMSRSEFVRSMVQAGRRGLDPGGNAAETASQESPESGTTSEETTSSESASGLASVEETILDLLAGECLSRDELVDELTRDIEDRVADAIVELQEANSITHDPREDGYVRTE